MAGLRQVGLLTAGAQPWNTKICAASGERFAYCATLAIYIYQWDQSLKKFNLHSVMSAHKKTITSISWHPRDTDVIASSSADREIVVWNIPEQKVIARINQVHDIPTCIEWCPHEKEAIAFTNGIRPLYIWHCPMGQSWDSELISHKETFSFHSGISYFAWSPKKTGKIAFGHNDGSISVLTPGEKAQKHVCKPEPADGEGSDEENFVQALQWDPLSNDYLLVANAKFGGMRLIDTTSASVITNFKLPSAAAKIKSFSWIPTAPGMFVTGDTATGVLRVWSVSKESPVLNLKLKQTGFHSLCVIPQTLNRLSMPISNMSSTEKQKGISSTSASLPGKRQSVHSNSYAIPPAHVVCTFLDGGIGLYDLGRRKWDFLRNYGHIETIFDCQFHPEDPDQLATSSFDGTVKVWNIQTMEAVCSTPGNESVIYSLSWAPADLNCIAAATSKCGCFIWNIKKGRLTKRFTEHGKASVYTIRWNQKDSNLIASAGADGFCIIRHIEGTLVKKYKHPAAVFGCDWSPKNRDILATGCEDKLVRVFYVPAKTESPIKVFSGHSAKVFHVKWCPLRDGILCSGSDDGTIRVWDYSQEDCLTVLEGHRAAVRGLLWNPEIPGILMSGSWDYSLRMWDIRTGYCLEMNFDHAADVYGLTSHPQRPFIVASCSRDSTVRILTLEGIMRPLYLRLLCGGSFQQLVSNDFEKAMQIQINPGWTLLGQRSNNVKRLIESENIKDERRLLKIYSQLFLPPSGVDNMWNLVSILLDGDKTNLPSSYTEGIVYSGHSVKYKAVENIVGLNVELTDSMTISATKSPGQS